MLSALFVLPYDIYVTLADCGVENAYWDPGEKQVVMCNEMIAVAARLFQQESAKPRSAPAPGPSPTPGSSPAPSTPASPPPLPGPKETYAYHCSLELMMGTLKHYGYVEVEFGPLLYDGTTLENNPFHFKVDSDPRKEAPTNGVSHFGINSAAYDGRGTVFQFWWLKQLKGGEFVGEYAKPDTVSLSQGIILNDKRISLYWLTYGATLKGQVTAESLTLRVEGKTREGDFIQATIRGKRVQS
jgi:hypothetical protein